MSTDSVNLLQDVSVFQQGGTRVFILCYIMGGSTAQSHGTVIQYEEYRTDDSGKYQNLFQIKTFNP